MALLQLNDYWTRRVASTYHLTPARRLGRGMFCAVYEDGPDAVWKLTADNIQYESVRDYLEGVHYPAFLEGPGYEATQCNGLGLYLFRAERLRPMKFADAPTRALARLLVSEANRHWGSRQSLAEARRFRRAPEQRQARTQVTLEQLYDSPALPQSLREAFADLLRMALNYGTLSLDVHTANLMVRGADELVLNDVIVDAGKVTRQ